MRRQGTALLLALAFAIVAGAPAAYAADSCKGQDDPVTEATIRQAERALLCLVNIHRASIELEPVLHDSSLRTAARAHSRDMVRRNYFQSTYMGAGPYDRAVAAGYPAGHEVGENLVLDPNATPENLFAGLVQSQPHNMNMLDPDWITAGMGLALGTPRIDELSGESGATGTQMFGTAQTDATGIAVELLVTDECRQARRDRSAAAREVRKAQHELETAETPSAEAVAQKHLKQAQRAFAKAKRRAQDECHPTSY